MREERACCHFAKVDVVDVIGMDGMNEVRVCAMKRNGKLFFFITRLGECEMCFFISDMTWHEI